MLCLQMSTALNEKKVPTFVPQQVLPPQAEDEKGSRLKSGAIPVAVRFEKASFCFLLFPFCFLIAPLSVNRLMGRPGS